MFVWRACWGAGVSFSIDLFALTRLWKIQQGDIARLRHTQRMLTCTQTHSPIKWPCLSYISNKRSIQTHKPLTLSRSIINISNGGLFQLQSECFPLSFNCTSVQMVPVSMRMDLCVIGWHWMKVSVYICDISLEWDPLPVYFYCNGKNSPK